MYITHVELTQLMFACVEGSFLAYSLSCLVSVGDSRHTASWMALVTVAGAGVISQRCVCDISWAMCERF
jgi:hypothetical protein